LDTAIIAPRYCAEFSGNADELLAAYRSTVIDSPQAEAMRSQAPAWARVVATALTNQ
jgi:hypothetical protein